MKLHASLRRRNPRAGPRFVSKIVARGPLKALREVEYVSTTNLPFLGLRSDTALAGVHYLTPLKVVSGQIRLSTTIRPPR